MIYMEMYAVTEVFPTILFAIAGYLAGRWHAKRIAQKAGPSVTIKGGGGPVEPK